MKIFTENQDLLGKKAYHDIRLEKLKERFNPPKITFISVEFTNENKEGCLCIVAAKGAVLDFIVEDVKGFKKGSAYSLFKIKQKLMYDKYGIVVKEI